MGASLILLLAATLAAEPPSFVVDEADPAVQRQVVQRAAGESLRENTLGQLERWGLGGKSREYGLWLPPRWEQTPPGDGLVIVIHGLHSNRHHLEPLVKCARQSGRPAGALEYPNDQPIKKSARLLAAELAAVRRSCPTRPVYLVTHSMGGLVARAAIEDPALDPGNVRRLVMIAPPNHGSILAECNSPLLDAWEYYHGDKRRRAAGLFYGSVEDGLGEAAVDLTPNSPFLRVLNSRSRNPRTTYTVFVGTQASVTDRQRPAGGEPTNGKRLFVASWTARWWHGELDEVVNGQGDGAVAVASARLDGVDDIVPLHFTHLGVLTRPDDPTIGRLYGEVLARLRDSP